ALAVVLAVPLAQPVRGFDHLAQGFLTPFLAHRLVGHLVEKAAADVGLAGEGVHADTFTAALKSPFRRWIYDGIPQSSVASSPSFASRHESPYRAGDSPESLE